MLLTRVENPHQSGQSVRELIPAAESPTRLDDQMRWTLPMIVSVSATAASSFNAAMVMST
jgi:hypothetical protein